MSDRANEADETEADETEAPSVEEIAASGHLRDDLDAAVSSATAAPGRATDDLVRSLRAAWSPAALDDGEHAAMLETLPMSEDELALAVQLRDALEPGALEDATIATLRAAIRPTTIDDDAHRRIVAAAVEAASPRANVASIGQRSTRAAATFATTFIALAASVVLWLTGTTSRYEAPLAVARSTQPLFGEPFKTGETSARVDRIALARATDLRDNRFAKWGVR